MAEKCGQFIQSSIILQTCAIKLISAITKQF